MENNGGWIFIDKTHYKDTKTGETFEIIRDSLKLDRINENGTISEMIKTIDENFKNIAAHGGGPEGSPGKDGINGTDGATAEYIFALCDEELKKGTHYPTTDDEKRDLFDSVDMRDSQWFPSESDKKIQWFNHPQGVSKDHKNEYVFSRYKRTSDGEWSYALKPELWAHWGETGKDGDGVEYIFMRSKTELDESTLKTIIKSKESMSGDQYQPIIYQMDDFFPGEEWFTGKNSAKNKRNAQEAIIAKYGNIPSNFDTLWKNKFNMVVPGYDWTDDPKGTDPIYVYEYVAIRRCNVDDEDGKEWSDFSTPAIWSHYGLSTRTIIIYCNTEDANPPVQPQAGQGHWNESKGELTLPSSLVDAGWSDTNTTPSENQITWMCSGIFDNSGKNVSWSKPMRITGENGKQGEDGTNIQFIYVLSEHMPEHPDPTTISGKKDTEKLFDDVEASTSKPKSVDRYGNTWFDRAQPISQSNPTEWIWSRRREKKTDSWEYDNEPIIWAHWGEDGTDGDGVEYIFYITDTETFDSSNNPPKVSKITGTTDLDRCKKLVYNIDDFYPDEKWFDDNEIKIKKVITDAGYDVSNYAGVKTFFDKGWRDNPIKVSPMNPYQWVSIRRSHADEETGGKRLWEDFSDPVLWNTYGQATRVFMIYCNVKNDSNPDIAPRRPQGGFWNVTPKSGEVMLAQDKDHLTTPYQYDVFESGVTEEDRNNHINVWGDDNIDKPGTISWVSSGVFSTDGKLIDTWSPPFRITGYKGETGADGSNIEYIYALCDEEPKYPKKGSKTEEEYKAILDKFFDDVNDSDNEGYWPETGNDRQKWTDNPQGISDDPGHKTEWVWQRSLPVGLEDVPGNWVYMPTPVIWSRWGEDGTDGDGVEYIFYATTNNPILDSQKPPKVSEITGTDNLSKCKRIIYNMREFFPNEDWFTSDNKKAVSAEVVKQNVMTSAEFDTLWTEHVGEGKDYFGFGIGWTDNPSDVNFNNPFEYVSIRRTVNDPESEKKIWGDYSEPKIWGTYNMKTRLFMVYRNVDEGTVVSKPEGGHWNYNEATGTDTFTPPTDWSDNNIDVPGKIAYLSSGLFAENGNNIYWSEPFRITGEKGRPGADGSTVEFIYCLSEDLPAFPYDSNPSTDYTIKCNFFESVENAKSDSDTEHDGYVYTDPSTGRTSEWFDNPQGISDKPGSRKEWVWSRSKSAVAENQSAADWTFPESPVIWSRWGEDGTDGDGVEYVFIVKTAESYPDDETSKEDWNSKWTVFTDTNASVTAKAIYAMDDFYPGPGWFTVANKENVKASMENPSKDFDENVWTQISTNMSALGNWTDNPENISATYKYQYVSIRKCVDGKWEAFSYPKLWAKYNLTTFKAFAFTSTPASAELGNLTFQAGISGTINNPLPIDENHTWTDGPNPTEKNPQVWMTSATIREDSLDKTTWAKPQRMTDNAEFQVEWSSDDITGSLLAEKILALAANTYNFGNFFTGDVTEDTAEKNWRDAVSAGLGLTFGDSSNNAVLMATCHKSNGKWSNWDLVRVKGETGEAGTSINMKTPIIYEIYLDDNNYTIANARTKFNAVKSTLTTPTPSKGYLAVVYPHDMDTNGIYCGDPNLGNALYMCKYNGSSWDEYYNETTVSSTDEAPGDTHPSPNGHLILWDGDSWMDVGNIVGPAGPVSEILVKYAKDGATAGTHEFVTDNQLNTAKYVGFITYPAGERPEWSLDEDGVGPNGETWNWQLFKGQDGFGYEYIFKTTSTYSAPLIPVEPTDGNWSTTPNVIPGNGISDTGDRNYGWVDEPMEPEANSKYVWMCWRKYDHSTQTWTKFQGSTKTGHTNEARLWHVFANTITEVIEYFHADITMSPSDIDTPVTNTEYWKTDKSQCGWDANKKYLFNVEVIKFLDGKSQTLDPHLIAVWETGLIDVIDYYILESANGSLGDGDPGEKAPHMNQDGITPVTSPTNESDEAGKDYWTTSVPKMTSSYTVLWNISKKVYEGGKPEQWTTPFVIGVYGEGKNGEDSIYIDLTNEMDSVQIDNDNKVITARTCSTTIKLYKGIELLEIADLDIAGEEAIDGNDDLSGITVTRTYHKGDTSSSYLAVSDYIDITFTIPVGCKLRPSHKIVFTVTSTEGIVRKTGYILVGTTHPTVYSIVPSASAVLVGENGTNPDRLNITVVKQTGSQLTSISGYSPSQGFKLYCQYKDNPKQELIGTPFSVYTHGTSAGDKFTFTVDVDTDGNNTYETTLDRETVYALIQGKNGDKGEGGNGYRYHYARYVNADSNRYNGYTKPSLQSYANTLDIPVFLLNGVSLPGSTSAQGADDSHTFEYRTEKFFDGSKWSDWSTPITIAKYLNADNIKEQVNDAVTNATKDIVTDLNNVTSRLSTYFDASGNLKTGLTDGVTTALLSGYIKDNELEGAINEIGLGGIVVTAGSTTTFADYYSKQENRITSVGQSLNALSGELNSKITTLNTSTNKIANALDSFKADTNAEFASMERTVANAKFMTDSEGYLMVKIPDCVVWFNSPSLLDGEYKDTNENRDVVWSIFFGMDTQETAETPPRPVYIPVDKLYRKDSDDKEWVTFLVMKDIPVNTYTASSGGEEVFSPDNVNLPYNFNQFNANNLSILYDKNNKKYIIKDNTELYTPFNGQYDTVIGEGWARIVATCTVNITDNPGTKYTGASISGFDTSNAYTYKLNNWTKGVLCDNMDFINPTIGATVDIKCACVKTGSINESPLLKSNNTVGYADVFTGTVKQGEYGYGLSYDNDSIVEVDTNGKVSIVSSPQMYFIPERTSVTDVMDYLNGSATPSITHIDDIPVHSGINSYYVLTHYNSAPSEPFSYTVDLPTSVISNKNVVNFSSDVFVNKFTKSSGNNDKTNGFSNVNNGEKDTSYRSINYTTSSNTKEIHDYYWTTRLTSPYDDIKFIFDCSNCKFTCANTLDNHDAAELVSIQMQYSIGGSSDKTITLYSNNSTDTTTANQPLFDTLTGVKTFNLSDFVTLAVISDLKFRLYVNLRNVGSCSISNIKLSYRVETKNKILDSKSTISGTGFSLQPDTDYNGNYESYGFGSNGYPVCHIPKTDISTLLPNKKIKVSTTFWDNNVFSNNIYPKYSLGVFLISSDRKSAKVNLNFEVSLDYNMKYLCIPAKYDDYSIKQIVDDCVGYFGPQFEEYSEDPDDPNITHFFEIAGENTFLNNNKYGTSGIYSWKETLTNFSYTVDFNDAVYSESDKRYYKTVLQYIKYDNTFLLEEFDTYVDITNISELSWTTSKDGLTRTALSVLDKYMIDKIDVIVNDRLRTKCGFTKRRANNNQNKPTKNYTDVIDVDKPYLIATVSELATISQMVSDGISCTQLITKAGENKAVFFEQASKDGSIIYMDADEVGIKSNYFTLNNDGLRMKGNLYAKDYKNNVTAGVIGNDTKSTDVKFFAGISVPEDSDDLGTSIDKAPFRVYEDGRLVATNAQISGNITANSVYSENTRTKLVNNVETQITQKAIMDSSKFEISTELMSKNSNTPQMAKIYITVLDEVTIDSSDPAYQTFGSKLSNVPTLCFEYMNNKYYLTPNSWKQRTENVYANTDIYFWNDGNEDNIYRVLSVSFKDSNYYTKSGNYYFYNPKSSNFVSGRPGKKYTFRYSVGDLSSGEIVTIVKKLEDNKLLNSACFDTATSTFKSNYIRLNMSNAKTPITDESIAGCAAAKSSCTGSVFEPINEQVHEVAFGGKYSDGIHMDSVTIPIQKLNTSVKNLLNEILYGDKNDLGAMSLLEPTSDFINMYGNPISTEFKKQIRMHLFDNGGESMYGYYTFTVNGAYETHYTNGNIDNTLTNSGEGFITGVYDFVISMSDTSHRFDIVTQRLGGSSINRTFNIKQLNIKVTIGAYAESGLNGTSSDKDTLINILKNSTIDPKNIHVYITCECRDGISEYDIVGPILGYGSKDSVS